MIHKAPCCSPVSRKPRLARTNPGNAEPQLGTNEERPAGAQQAQAQRGWYSRGYLPHTDFPGLVQMITYRLADSLPAAVLQRIADELRSTQPNRREAEWRRRVEQWLDAGHGCCVRRQPAVAECVVKT